MKPKLERMRPFLIKKGGTDIFHEPTLSFGASTLPQSIQLDKVLGRVKEGGGGGGVHHFFAKKTLAMHHP